MVYIVPPNYLLTSKILYSLTKIFPFLGSRTFVNNHTLLCFVNLTLLISTGRLHSVCFCPTLCCDMRWEFPFKVQPSSENAHLPEEDGYYRLTAALRAEPEWLLSPSPRHHRAGAGRIQGLEDGEAGCEIQTPPDQCARELTAAIAP